MPAQDPLLLYNVAAQLLECARAELATTDAGEPALVSVVDGLPAHDNCCDGGGQLYAYVETIAPMTSFGAVDPAPIKCAVGSLGITVVVGVVRCAPGLDDNGNPPAASVIDASAREKLADMLALFTSVTCCLAAWNSDPDGWEGQVLSHRSIPPLGMCAGSEMRVLVTVDDPCWCVP